jgi:hypothetical protein
MVRMIDVVRNLADDTKLGQRKEERESMQKALDKPVPMARQVGHAV